jgi:transcriptional regulator with XRE-family HTH domain
MIKGNERILREFGKNLRKLRQTKGLSTRKFAYEADIAHSAVGKLESGSSNPTLTTLIKISEALGVDLDKLVPHK